jgi:SAM-dependent methyltransferase
MTSENNQLWNRRFRTEQQIWGSDPSPTLLRLLKKIPQDAKILELGFGYGRDLLALVKRGFCVDGVDLSIEGLHMTANALDATEHEWRPCLWLADFAVAPVAKGHYDAVFSHRTLHLIPDVSLHATITQIAKTLKPGGIVCISARDKRDFNENQMIMGADGTAAYKAPERKGHRIRFWNEKLFLEYFSSGFCDFQFQQSEEPESEKNAGVSSFFTIMTAKRKE